MYIIPTAQIATTQQHAAEAAWNKTLRNLTLQQSIRFSELKLCKLDSNANQSRKTMEKLKRLLLLLARQLLFELSHCSLHNGPKR